MKTQILNIALGKKLLAFMSTLFLFFSFGVLTNFAPKASAHTGPDVVCDPNQKRVTVSGDDITSSLPTTTSGSLSLPNGNSVGSVAVSYTGSTITGLVYSASPSTASEKAYPFATDQGVVIINFTVGSGSVNFGWQKGDIVNLAAIVIADNGSGAVVSTPHNNGVVGHIDITGASSAQASRAESDGTNGGDANSVSCDVIVNLTIEESISLDVKTDGLGLDSSNAATTDYQQTTIPVSIGNVKESGDVQALVKTNSADGFKLQIVGSTNLPGTCSGLTDSTGTVLATQPSNQTDCLTNPGGSGSAGTWTPTNANCAVNKLCDDSKSLSIPTATTSVGLANSETSAWWGYRAVFENNVTPPKAFTAFANGDGTPGTGGTAYNAIPASATTLVSETCAYKGTVGNVDDTCTGTDDVNLTQYYQPTSFGYSHLRFGAAVSASTPSGVYKGKVTLTAIPSVA